MMDTIRQPKRDFIFVDEAGEPGEKTAYYVQGLIHVTDRSLKKLNVHLGAFRYFGNIGTELKSTRLGTLHSERDSGDLFEHIRVLQIKD